MGRRKKNAPEYLYRILPRYEVPDMEIACVYRIYFYRGEKYYLGRTKNLRKRMASHLCDINRYMRFWREDRNDQNMYVHLLDHLVSTGSFTGYYEVLEVCEPTEDSLTAAEQRWFDKCKSDPKCLNLGFVAKPWKPKESGTKMI